MTHSRQSRAFNLIFFIFEQPIYGLLLRFFKNKNKKTGSRHYIQSIQNQIKLFHQLEILQKKENISKNSTRVTGLQLIKKDNLDDSDVYGRNGIPIIIINVNLGLISEINILTQ
jgi:hypothetical protein